MSCEVEEFLESLDYEELDGEEVLEDSEEDIREIIAEYVQNYPCLYDTSNKNYFDKICKNNAWEAISTMIHIPSDVVKKKWRAMKAVYFRAKRGLASGSSAREPPQFVKCMRFMDGDSAPKKTWFAPSTTTPRPKQSSGIYPNGSTQFRPISVASQSTSFGGEREFATPTPQTKSVAPRSKSKFQSEPIKAQSQHQQQQENLDQHMRNVTSPKSTAFSPVTKASAAEKKQKANEQFDRAVIQALGTEYSTNQHFMLSMVHSLDTMPPETLKRVKMEITKLCLENEC